MRRALLVAALAVGVGAMALTRGGPAAVAPPAPERAPAAPPRPAPVLAPLSRSPFEFAPGPETEREAPRLAARRPAERSDVVVPEPSATLRLIGFVHQGEHLKAALVLEGETVLLAVGEVASGYTLLAADASSGVRLSAPDGTERTLPLPE